MIIPRESTITTTIIVIIKTTTTTATQNIKILTNRTKVEHCGRQSQHHMWTTCTANEFILFPRVEQPKWKKMTVYLFSHYRLDLILRTVVCWQRNERRTWKLNRFIQSIVSNWFQCKFTSNASSFPLWPRSRVVVRFYECMCVHRCQVRWMYSHTRKRAQTFTSGTSACATLTYFWATVCRCARKVRRTEKKW